jgi:hypothetical protein
MTDEEKYSERLINVRDHMCHILSLQGVMPWLSVYSNIELKMKDGEQVVGEITGDYGEHYVDLAVIEVKVKKKARFKLPQYISGTGGSLIDYEGIDMIGNRETGLPECYFCEKDIQKSEDFKVLAVCVNDNQVRVHTKCFEEEIEYVEITEEEDE